jgi:hypothetical protein
MTAMIYTRRYRASGYYDCLCGVCSTGFLRPF